MLQNVKKVLANPESTHGGRAEVAFLGCEVNFDPGCVKTCRSQECAELFSLSSSLSSGRKHFWFSNLRNRDGISARRLNVGVFTWPSPISDINTPRPNLAIGRLRRLEAARLPASLSVEVA